MPFATLLPLGLASGGYFPTAWGYGAVGLLWVAGVCVAVPGRPHRSRPDSGYVVSLAALTAWVAVSLLWTESVPATMYELQRTLLYLAAVVAVLAAARTGTAEDVLAGILAACTAVCAYALLVRLVPGRLGAYDEIAGDRLAEPVAYWNGLALVAAIGLVLGFGLALRAGSPGLRAAAAATLPILAPVLALTYSRGGLAAMGLGLAVAVAVDPRRLGLVAALPALTVAPALAVWVALSADPIGPEGRAVGGTAVGALVAIPALAVLAGALALAQRAAERRVSVGSRLRTVAGVTLVLALLGAGAAVSVQKGGPVALARDARAAFVDDSPAGTADDRLLSLSGNGRAQLWRVAWADQFATHRWLGSGPGTFERFWMANRPRQAGIRNAHNLYLETLAELGPVGVALLLAALGVPAAAALRARKVPVVPVALGAYVAFLFHAGLDWDWELPVVTVAAVTCGAAVVVAARPAKAPPLSGRARASALALLTAAMVVAGVGLVGNAATRAAAESVARGDFSSAAREARKAQRWAPWSPAPWTWQGESRFARGDVTGSRSSFERALARDTGDWKLWLDVARVAEGHARDRALLRAAALNPRAIDVDAEEERER